ncbi:MAG: hypothetical protein IKB32_01150 [Clostridia bacterium]|nr:hypothetical protein [Clostridia bacterium]
MDIKELGNLEKLTIKDIAKLLGISENMFRHIDGRKIRKDMLFKTALEIMTKERKK